MGIFMGGRQRRDGAQVRPLVLFISSQHRSVYPLDLFYTESSVYRNRKIKLHGNFGVPLRSGLPKKIAFCTFIPCYRIQGVLHASMKYWRSWSSWILNVFVRHNFFYTKIRYLLIFVIMQWWLVTCFFSAKLNI